VWAHGEGSSTSFLNRMNAVTSKDGWDGDNLAQEVLR
jgi:hypothetical protein